MTDAAATSTATAPRSHSRAVGLALVLVASCIAYVLSEGARFGDSTTYARQIMSGALIEPGHLLWRPLGYVLGHMLGTLDAYSSTLWTLQGLCLAASLAGLVAIYVLCSKVADPWIALFVAAFTAVSNGYWAYAFSGCSYTCGILFQTLALHYAVRERTGPGGWRNAFAAGGLGGLAAAAWAINALMAPAILVALLSTTAGSYRRLRQSLHQAGLFALGYGATFAIPVALAYLLMRVTPRWRVGVPASSGMSFAQWLSSARHDVPFHVGSAQLLRAALGWAQSVISLSDVGYRLRLWRLGEGPFPFSLWSLVAPAFYAGVLLLALILLRGRARLDLRSRSLLYAAILAVALNLAFGVAWQGTDLERYMPSWPFQMALLAIALNLLWERVERARFLPVMITALVALLLMNWQGTFKPLLARDSYRNAWVSAIAQHASRGDLVLVFGQRKVVIVAPHNENFPKVLNLSDEIEKGGSGWRATEIEQIRLTQSRGGRVFLDDALFRLDAAPRDGWSFKEYPVPTPREIHDTFLPFKSDSVAFTAAGEPVWAARTGSGE
jgi:hypothetical protein